MLRKIMLIIAIIGASFYSLAQDDAITSIVWSDDQSLLAIAKRNGFIDIFNVTINQVVLSINTNSGFVTQMVWDPTNQRIATSHPDAMIRIWDVNTGILLQEISSYEYTPLALEWSDNQKLIFSLVDAGTYIWDMNTYQFENKFLMEGFTFDFSPDGINLAFGTRSTVAIYNLQDEGILFLNSYSEPVFNVMWNSDGTKLASMDISGNFSVWNFQTNQIETEFQMENTPYFNSEGIRTIPNFLYWDENNFYIMASGKIDVWDTTTWQVISSVPLELGFFVARNSTGDLYAEFSGSEIEISTYCEIIPSGDTLALSNAILDGNSIQFHKQICLTENATYTLTASLPDITGNITLIGNGAQIVMTGEAQIFNIAENGTLTLKNVTIVSENAEQAIFNAGELNLENVTFENREQGE